MITDTWIQTDSINHLPTIQPMQLCIGIQFVEKCHSHQKIGIGKQLDHASCFCAVSKEHRNILFDGTLQQQIGKHLSPL